MFKSLFVFLLLIFFKKKKQQKPKLVIFIYLFLRLFYFGSARSLLWHVGLVDPWHVGSSWTRDETHVPGIGRQILNPWITRKVLNLILL